MPDAKRITLVTGATGFLGTHLCKRLQQEGIHVRATGRSSADGPWQEFVEFDLSEDAQLPKNLFEDVHTVFHLASIAHADKYSAGKISEVIAAGTQKLVSDAEAAGVAQFIYFSSIKAMGEGNPASLSLSPISENWPHNPTSDYGCAKLEAESIVLKASIRHRTVLRPVMVYGNGQKGNLPKMIHAIQKGTFPPIPENGNKRSMIHVVDLIEFAIRSAQYPVASGKTYIVASNKPVSTRGLYNMIRRALDMPAIDWSIPSWLLTSTAFAGTLLRSLTGKSPPFDLDVLNKLIGSAWYSSELAQRELRYQPLYELEDWLLENPPNKHT